MSANKNHFLIDRPLDTPMIYAVLLCWLIWLIDYIVVVPLKKTSALIG